MKLFLLVLIFGFGLTTMAATVEYTGTRSIIVPKTVPSTITWSSLASGDNGSAVESGSTDILSVQFSGTFTATTVVLEGSNDGTTYYTLDDIEGTTISKTSATLVMVRDKPKYIRPRISAGGASTDVTSVIYMAK